MAEYIDVPNLILFLKCGEYESSEDVIKFIENNVTTDVIERSKIDKAIEEMERIIADTSYFYTSEGVKLALKIIKRNIGE